MATYKNATDHHIDIPLLDLHLAPGDTFEVPDEAAYSFDNNPDLAPSRAKNPGTVIDADTAAGIAPIDGAVPPLSAATAPVVPTDPNA